MKRKVQLEKQIEEFKATLKDSKELELLSIELEKQEEIYKSLNTKLVKYKDVDPEVFKLKRMTAEVVVYRTSANITFD